MDPTKIHQEMENIVQQLIRKYRPLRIILFGSAARGEYDKVNDLDLLILKYDVPFRGLDRMRELDDLIDRNMTADMLVYRPDELEHRIKLGDPFIKSILSEGAGPLWLIRSLYKNDSIKQRKILGSPPR